VRPRRPQAANNCGQWRTDHNRGVMKKDTTLHPLTSASA